MGKNVITSYSIHYTKLYETSLYTEYAMPSSSSPSVILLSRPKEKSVLSVIINTLLKPSLLRYDAIFAEDSASVTILVFLILKVETYNLSRITSYNVCYTKLLRIAAEAEVDTDITEMFNWLVDNQLTDGSIPMYLANDGDAVIVPYFSSIAAIAILEYGRITSYNVCYTKLLRLLFCIFENKHHHQILSI